MLGSYEEGHRWWDLRRHIAGEIALKTMNVSISRLAFSSEIGIWLFFSGKRRVKKERIKLKLPKDVGLIPEAMMEDIAKNTTLYEYARSGKYPLLEIMQTLEELTSGDMQKIIQHLQAKKPIIRYWAETACTFLGERASQAERALKKLTNDPEAAVRIAAAEALYHLGEKEIGVQTLKKALKIDNQMARVQAINVLETMGTDAMPYLACRKSFAA